MVEVLEPARLTVVRPLATDLEVQPLVDVVPVGQASIGQAMLRVVLLGDVGCDGTRFPQRQTCVGVLNSRDTAIGVDVGEWLLLYVVKAKSLNLVRNTELLQKKYSLPR